MRKQVRKLVSLNVEQVSAVERFRHTEEARTRRCPHCKEVIGIEPGPVSESTALRRLIELGFEYRERRSVSKGISGETR